MISEDIIDAMVANGCTAEQIAAVVKASMRSDEERRERRRAADAERQRRYRSRNAESRVTTRDNSDPSPSSSPPKPPLTTPPSDIPPGPLKGSDPPDTAQPAEQPFDEVQQAVDEWNETATPLRLPVVQKVTDARRSAVRARLRDAGGLDGWRYALAKIRGDPFFHGENDRGWKADFEFFTNRKKFIKLMEGGYDRAECGGHRPNGKPHRTQQSDRRAILEGLGLAADGGQFDRDFGSDGGFAPGGY